MAEFEDMLNKVLNDPKQMEQIMGIASNFMGNSGAEQENNQSQAMPTAENIMSNINSNPKIASLLKNFGGMGKGSGGLASLFNSKLGQGAKKLFTNKGSSSDKKELISGICPYLSAERRDKLERAYGLARTLNSAGSAFLGKGGKGS